MPAIIIDTLKTEDFGTFVITEVAYGRARKYGLRQLVNHDRWIPIGGVTKSLEGAYQRFIKLISGDPEVTEMHRQAQMDHDYRFRRAA